MTNLFQQDEFILSSGKKSSFKINCDVLTKEDWDTLASLAVQILPKFSSVMGIPTGGEAFANSLSKYVEGEYGQYPILIADDVLTTGRTMNKYYKKLERHNPIGIVVFSRGLRPIWIQSIFQMGMFS